MLFVVLLTTAYAAATTVSIADAVVEPDGVVTLPIVIDNITNYGVGTMNIEYDSSIVHVTSVTGSSDSNVVAKNINNTMGFARILASNLGGVSGDIVFANVEFTAVGLGSTPLNIDVISLRDSAQYDISANISDGSITIPIPGDVNDDGHLTTADAAIVLQMATRGEYSEVADVSRDDTVTSLDALMILQAVDQEG
jgi:hypothetical protein